MERRYAEVTNHIANRVDTTGIIRKLLGQPEPEQMLNISDYDICIQMDII